MNTDKVFDSVMASSWGLGQFTQWGDQFKRNPVALPLHEMVLDVSLTGAFLENIPERRRMHTPFWGEDSNNIHMPADEETMGLDDWMTNQRRNVYWDLHQTPFNIPEIMKYHLGKKKYTLRPQLLEALKHQEEQWR